MPSYTKDQQLHKDRMSVNEYRALTSKKNKRPKYNNTKQTYGGYNYDSKLEASHAKYLDMLMLEGTVDRWERQHKIQIKVSGVHIANYYIDFKVYMADGTIEYHEVKGAETQIWRMKWKLCKALYPDWNFKIFK